MKYGRNLKEIIEEDVQRKREKCNFGRGGIIAKYLSGKMLYDK